MTHTPIPKVAEKDLRIALNGPKKVKKCTSKIKVDNCISVGPNKNLEPNLKRKSKPNSLKRPEKTPNGAEFTLPQKYMALKLLKTTIDCLN